FTRGSDGTAMPSCPPWKSGSRRCCGIRATTPKPRPARPWTPPGNWKESVMTNRVLVTGAGGFIGHHLVSFLKMQGYWVRGADLKPPEYAASDADEFLQTDLRRWENCIEATRGVEEVYALAADMGGMGFISAHHAEILHNNSLINIHTLEAARSQG